MIDILKAYVKIMARLERRPTAEQRSADGALTRSKMIRDSIPQPVFISWLLLSLALYPKR